MRPEAVRDAARLSLWRSFDGRYRIRLREIHLRDHLAPLLASSAHGAVKLDIVLRGLASLPDGSAPVGLVSPEMSWELLHDLARDASFYGTNVVLKRQWVSDKLARLEQLNLIARELRPGTRPRIVVLRDDGSGEDFDDPTGGTSSSYVTVLGTIIAFGRLTEWRSPELSAYLAAMIAERYARADATLAASLRLHELPFGGGAWYRPLNWFADPDERRPLSHVRVPFSERTLRRGIRSLKTEGLMWSQRISADPRTGKDFGERPRVLYVNGFDDVRHHGARGRNRYLDLARIPKVA